MMSGRVTWVSPKGYGFILLEDGREAYAPASLLAKIQYPKDGRDVRVSVCAEQGRLICSDVYEPSGLMALSAIDSGLELQRSGVQVIYNDRELAESDIEKSYGQFLGDEPVGQTKVEVTPSA